MKITVLVIALAINALAADPPAANTTEPGKLATIPKERHEEISRAMIAVQAKQLDVAKAERALVKAKEDAADIEGKYGAYLESLRKEFKVESCSGYQNIKPDLGVDKNWVCPDAPMPALPAPKPDVDPKGGK